MPSREACCPVGFVPSVYPARLMSDGASTSTSSERTGGGPGVVVASAWPPPRPGTPQARDLFESARTRDPLGDRVHFWIAVLALAMQPIHPIPAAIGQGMVIFYALLRLHATWRGAMPLLRSPLVVVAILVPVWTAVAVVWSPDPRVGLEDLLPLRFPLFALCLWPMRDRVRPLVFALATGCAVQALVQTSMFVGLVPNLNTQYEAWTQTGGLGKHPGNTALFAAVVLPILLGRLMVAEDRRVPTAFLVILCAASVVLAGNRTLFLVVPVALTVALLRVAVSRRFIRDRWRSTLVAGTTVVLAIVLTPIVAPNSLVVKRIDAMVREVERAFVDGQYQSSGGRRLYWWREALPVVRAAPVLGHGSGSMLSAMSAHLEASRSEAEVERFVTDNPHSTLVTEAIERGAIGVLLWSLLAWFGLAGARRVSNIEPHLTGLVAAWIVLVGYGLSASVQLSGINTAVLAILLFLTLPPPIVSTVSRGT